MYLEIEIMLLIIPLLWILLAIISSLKQKNSDLKQAVREFRAFYKPKSNREITDFLIKDLIKYGIDIKKFNSSFQVCQYWEYLRYYERKYDSNYESVDINEFNKLKLLKHSERIVKPHFFQAVDIDLNEYQ